MQLEDKRICGLKQKQYNLHLPVQGRTDSLDSGIHVIVHTPLSANISDGLEMASDKQNRATNSEKAINSAAKYYTSTAKPANHNLASKKKGDQSEIIICTELANQSSTLHNRISQSQLIQSQLIQSELFAFISLNLDSSRQLPHKKRPSTLTPIFTIVATVITDQ